MQKSDGPSSCRLGRGARRPHSAISPQPRASDAREARDDEHGAPAAGASREHPAGAEQPRAAREQGERRADIDSDAAAPSQRAVAARFDIMTNINATAERTQEEIATAHDSKAKLCETIGSLQHAKEEREHEIKQLKLELRASRESQSTLMKKMHRLEDETRDMKRGYIKSLACRMKTATQLLSQLQSASVYPRIQDMEITAEAAEKCEEWIGSEPNKRKRALAKGVPNPAEADDEQAIPQNSGAEDAASAQDAEMTSPEDALLSNAPEETQASGKPLNQDPKDCESCFVLKSAHESERAELQGKIDQMQKMMEILQADHDSAAMELTESKAKQDSAITALLDRDSEINQLQEQLANAESKLQELSNAAPVNSSNIGEEEQAEFESRIKVLEDNLTQMNAYADHLEIVIGQCPSCSVKVQTESTQDIENKAA